VSDMCDKHVRSKSLFVRAFEPIAGSNEIADTVLLGVECIFGL
jgi:hypothetical protein